MTLIELQDKLDRLSAWRKYELIQAKSLIENNDEGDEKTKYLLRSWTVFIYAHCDSFLKEATSAYLEYINDNHHSLYLNINKTLWLIFKGKDNVLDANHKNYLSPDEIEKGLKDSLATHALKQKSFSYKTLRFIIDWLRCAQKVGQKIR